jgi:hypothetical protein
MPFREEGCRERAWRRRQLRDTETYQHKRHQRVGCRLAAHSHGLAGSSARESGDPNVYADGAGPALWGMMQVAMLAGSATSYPVNWWLVRVGIKEAM